MGRLLCPVNQQENLRYIQIISLDIYKSRGGVGALGKASFFGQGQFLKSDEAVSWQQPTLSSELEKGIPRDATLSRWVVTVFFSLLTGKEQSFFSPSDHCQVSCVLSHFSHVQFCATLWTKTHQAPLSMGFSRQEYWSGLPCLLHQELFTEWYLLYLPAGLSAKRA